MWFVFLLLAVVLGLGALVFLLVSFEMFFTGDREDRVSSLIVGVPLTILSAAGLILLVVGPLTPNGEPAARADKSLQPSQVAEAERERQERAERERAEREREEREREERAAVRADVRRERIEQTRRAARAKEERRRAEATEKLERRRARARTREETSEPPDGLDLETRYRLCDEARGGGIINSLDPATEEMAEDELGIECP